MTTYDPFMYQPNVAVWYGDRPFSHAQIAAAFASWLKGASPRTYGAILAAKPTLLYPQGADVSPAGAKALSGLGDIPGTANSVYSDSLQAGAGNPISPDNTGAAVNLFSTWAQEIMSYATQHAQSQAELEQVKAQLASAERGQAIQAGASAQSLAIAGAIGIGIVAVLAFAKRKR